MEDDWSARAKCLGMPSDIFFNNQRGGDQRNGGANQAAIAICTGARDGSPCPVIRECFDHAVANDETGVWGGVYHEGIMATRKNKQRRHPPQPPDVTVYVKINDGRAHRN